MVSSSTPGKPKEDEEEDSQRKHLRFFPKRNRKRIARAPSLEECQEATESFVAEDDSINIDDLRDFQVMWESSIAGDLDTTEETTKDASKSEEVEPRREEDEKKMSEAAAAVLQLTPNYQSYEAFFIYFVATPVTR